MGSSSLWPKPPYNLIKSQAAESQNIAVNHSFDQIITHGISSGKVHGHTN